MEKDIIKHYSNGEVTVVWKPSACIHSKLCWHGLPTVFNPRERPWVKADAATTQQIKDQVDKCPSGALSYFMNTDEKKTIEVTSETSIEIVQNGPLLVYGNLKIKDAEGNETAKNKVTAFCRCGQSSNKPYCDGAHNKIGFIG
ncbi:MAG: hypothetical protein EOO88_34640 [Pedobacter sp.]|nr:MAG: hypothetical protein EOO88_34640 [Pedobacter sp.]